jgi:peptidoglycan/LPS O-acetylase OafA/YrhL
MRFTKTYITLLITQICFYGAALALLYTQPKNPLIGIWPLGAFALFGAINFVMLLVYIYFLTQKKVTFQKVTFTIIIGLFLINSILGSQYLTIVNAVIPK